MVGNEHLERLNSAADSARTELENRALERWEFFAKASFTRQVEMAPGRPLDVINVEEMGVAVRSVRQGRAGFAAASATVRVMGPTESSSESSGIRPAPLMRPKVCLSPTRPQMAAGMRTDPPVSVPSAAGARSAATPTAEPLLEPPGTRWVEVSHGFQGVP